MPTRRALRDSGARLLELAILQRGGPDAVASELGFRARRGNHVSWENLLRDLQQVIHESATPAGIMPSRRAFVAAGRLDVYRRAPVCLCTLAFLFLTRWPPAAPSQSTGVLPPSRGELALHTARCEPGTGEHLRLPLTRLAGTHWAAVSGPRAWNA